MFWRISATIVLTLILIICEAGSVRAARPLRQSFLRMEPPREIPNFIVRDSSGQILTLHEVLKREANGGFVLLNVWATWCVPCIGEMQSLNSLQGRLKGLTVVTLAEDQEGQYSVPAMMRRNNYSQVKVYLDPEGLAVRRFRLRGIPTTLLINASGLEVGRVKSNVDWMNQDNLAFLDQLVNTPDKLARR